MALLLTINSIPYGTRETLSLRQSYGETEGGARLLRLADGSAKVQCLHAPKLTTTLAGQAWMPPGFETLALYRVSYTLACVAPRTLVSATASITLPAARRSDAAIETTALVGDQWVEAAATLASNTLTFTAIPHVQAYRASYVPQITARLVDRTIDCEVWGARWAWSLKFEEV